MSEDTRLDRASTLVPSLHARFRSRRGWRTSASGTLRTSHEVRLESVMRTKTNIRQHY
jgi:hypothetical protein